MTALETVLTVVVLLLGGVLIAGVIIASRLARVMRTGSAPATASLGERDAVELAGAESSLDLARTTIVRARSEAAAARADAAAAKAEATAARSEAQRILDSARTEADGLLDRAHRQAEHDAEQVRSTARRAGEREIATLTTVTKEQAADAERRQQRLDDRERLLAEEAERVAERDRRLAAAEADLTDREAAIVSREQEISTAAEARRRELERVAGLTADAAKSGADRVHRRPRPNAMPRCWPATIENEARTTGRGSGPPHRGRGDPTGGQRADRGERGQRAAPALATR